MDRRAFLGTLTGGLLAAPLIIEAQQAGRVARIGFLNNGAQPSAEELMKAIAASPFWRAMKELGWVEGQNIVVERRWGQSADQLSAAADELVRLKVDVIVGNGTPSPLAAKRATNTIPIVMVAAGDPVATGLVASLAKPGGNVTGTSTRNPELTGKWLQLTKEIVPGLSRVAVLWNAANPVSALAAKETEAAARILGVQVQSVEVRGPDDFETALPGAVSGGAGALLVVDDPLHVPVSEADRRLRGPEPAAGDGLLQAVCGGRGAHDLWAELGCFRTPCGVLRRQDLERGQARRPPR